MIVHHVWDINLRQEYEVVVTLLDGTNILGKSKAMDSPDIIRPQVEYRGAGQTVPRQRRCQVKAVSDMPYWSGAPCCVSI